MILKPPNSITVSLPHRQQIPFSYNRFGSLKMQRSPQCSQVNLKWMSILLPGGVCSTALSAAAISSSLDRSPALGGYSFILIMLLLCYWWFTHKSPSPILGVITIGTNPAGFSCDQGGWYFKWIFSFLDYSRLSISDCYFLHASFGWATGEWMEVPLLLVGIEVYNLFWGEWCFNFPNSHIFLSCWLLLVCAHLRLLLFWAYHPRLQSRRTWQWCPEPRLV